MLLDSCPHALIQNTHPECERSAESLACRQDLRGGCCETRHPHPSLLSACVEIVGHSGRALLRQPRRSLYGRFRPPNQLQSRWERGNSPSANVVFCRPAHADNVYTSSYVARASAMYTRYSFVARVEASVIGGGMCNFLITAFPFHLKVRERTENVRRKKLLYEYGRFPSVHQQRKPTRK